MGGIVSVGSLLGLLIVVTGILGAAFRTSRNVQTINNYRDAAQSWEARANAQETEMADQQRQIDACNVQITNLESQLGEKDKQLGMLQQQIITLRDLLSGRAAFESLSEKISESLQLAAETRRDMHTVLEIEQARGPTP